MAASVRALVFVGSAGKTVVPLPPWETFSESARRALQRLDANGDGELVASDVPGADARRGSESREVEVRRGPTADELGRVLFHYGRLNHHNHRVSDRATRDERKAGLTAFQQAIFDRVVRPVWGEDPGQRKGRLSAGDLAGIRRVLSVSADFARLYGMAVIAMGAVDPKIGRSDRDYAAAELEILRTAEGMLIDALAFAAKAGVHGSEAEYVRKIQEALRALDPVLDRADKNSFRTASQLPYLLAAEMTPVMLKRSDLQRGLSIEIGVAVSPGFARAARDQGLDGAVLRYFRENPPLLRPSRPDDHHEARTVSLSALHVEKDGPGPQGDRGFYNDPARSDRTTFLGAIQEGRPAPMEYFRVRFLAGPKLASALDGLPSRAFDILDPRPAGRVIERGFLLQDDVVARPVRLSVFTDPHVSMKALLASGAMQEAIRAEAEKAQEKGEMAEYERLQDLAQAVDRFYVHNFHGLDALFRKFDEEHRAGRIRFAVSLGDNVDYVRIQDSLVGVPEFRDTNYRLLRHLFRNRGVPILGTEGNHGDRAVCHIWSEYPENFPLAPRLQGEHQLYRDYFGPYPSHAMGGPEDRLIAMVRSFVRDPLSRETDWVPYMLDEGKGRNGSKPKDGFTSHYFREFGPLQNVAYDVGHGTTLVLLRTESENFNLSGLLKETKDPVSVLRQLMKTIVSSTGPKPEAFVFLLDRLNEAKARSGQVVLMGHHGFFNLFKNRDGSLETRAPEGTPFAADAVAGTASDLLRLIAWYYGKTLPLVLSGHVHDPQELRFTFDLSTGEAERLRAELKLLFEKPSAEPRRLFEETERLYREYRLNDRIRIHSVVRAGRNGWPGPILEDFNRDSRTSAPKFPNVFYSLPNAGIPSPEDMVGSQLGYATLTVHPDGRLQLENRFFELDENGALAETDGRGLESFRLERWRKAREWDPEFRYLAPFRPRTRPTAMLELSSRPDRKDALGSLLAELKPPVLCPPGADWCLLAGAEFGAELFYNPKPSWVGVDARLIVNFLSVRKLWDGAGLIPEHLQMDLGYNVVQNAWAAALGAKWGVVSVFFNAGKITEDQLRLGAELRLHSRTLMELLPGGGTQSLNLFFELDPGWSGPKPLAWGLSLSGEMAFRALGGR